LLQETTSISKVQNTKKALEPYSQPPTPICVQCSLVHQEKYR